jgi:hypothetical protein
VQTGQRKATYDIGQERCHVGVIEVEHLIYQSRSQIQFGDGGVGAVVYEIDVVV